MCQHTKRGKRDAGQHHHYLQKRKYNINTYMNESKSYTYHIYIYIYMNVYKKSNQMKLSETKTETTKWKKRKKLFWNLFVIAFRIYRQKYYIEFSHFFKAWVRNIWVCSYTWEFNNKIRIVLWLVWGVYVLHKCVEFPSFSGHF